MVFICWVYYWLLLYFIYNPNHLKKKDQEASKREMKQQQSVAASQIDKQDSIGLILNDVTYFAISW
jgi:hypothetical protein